MALADEVWAVLCLLILGATLWMLYKLTRHAFRTLRIDRCLASVPRPKASRWPLVGHTQLLLSDPRPWCTMKRWGEDLGTSIFTFSYLGQRHVYLSDPKLFRHVLLDNHRNYAKEGEVDFRKKSRNSGGRESHYGPLLGPRSVVNQQTDGAEWKKLRMSLNRGLQALTVGVVNNDIIPFQTLGAVHRVVSLLRTAETLEAPVDLAEVFSHASLQMTAEMLLGLEPAECDDLLPKLYLPLAAECERQAWNPWTQVSPSLGESHKKAKQSKALDDALRALIRVRWALKKAETEGPAPPAPERRGPRLNVATSSGGNPSVDSRSESSSLGAMGSFGADESSASAATAATPREPDLLDYFLNAVPQLSRETEAEVGAQIKTILLQAHDTTATTLTWTFLEVLADPEIAVRLCREWEDVFGHLAIGEVPTMEMIKRLRWAPAVIREAQRLHSPLPQVTRRAREDDVLTSAETGLPHDLVIPKGATVVLGIDSVHGKSTLWSDPGQFKPSRFIDYDEQILNGDLDPYAFLPYLHGPRSCPGQGLSMLQMQMMVSYVITGMMAPQDGMMGSTNNSNNAGGTTASDLLVFELAHEREKLSKVQGRRFPVVPAHGLPIKPIRVDDERDESILGEQRRR